MTSNGKSATVNRCVFTRNKFLPNFIPIRFETTERLAFVRSSPQQEEEEEDDDDDDK